MVLIPSQTNQWSTSGIEYLSELRDIDFSIAKKSGIGTFAVVNTWAPVAWKYFGLLKIQSDIIIEYDTTSVTVEHDMPYEPMVQTINVNWVPVVPSSIIFDGNSVTIMFSAPFTGVIKLR